MDKFVISDPGDPADLRTSRDWAAQTLEHVSDSVLVLDSEWRVVFMNARAARLLGRQGAGLVGEDLWLRFPEAASGSIFWDQYHTAMETQSTATFEAYHAARGGWLEVRIFPAPDTLTVYLRDITARKATERERERLVATVQAALGRAQQLQAIMAALGEAMTLDQVVDVVLAQTKELLATLFAAVVVFGDDGRALRTLRLDQLPEELVQRWIDAGQSSSSPIGDAIGSRRPVFHNSRQARTEQYPHMAGVSDGIGGEASAMLPLVAGGRVIGVLALAWADEHDFDSEERTFLATLARQCGEAIQRAVLFEQQHRVATILQRAILPDDLPDLDELSFAARYLPSEAGVEVGGDWFDAFRCPDGSVWLSIGDVGGHGVLAASIMSQLRNSVRACAYAGLSPARSMDVLDQLLPGSASDLYATAVVLTYDPATGVLQWSNAGHPPPILASPMHGARLLDGAHDSLLGLHNQTPFATRQADFPPGGVLVLYTDGLIERRGSDIQDAISHLVGAVGKMALNRSAETLCERILAAAFAGHNRQDDLCLLVAKRLPLALVRTGQSEHMLGEIVHDHLL